MRSISMFQNFVQVANQSFYAAAFVVLRMVMGMLFLSSGFQKLISGWAGENLASATSPFLNEWFHSLAGNVFVAQLNIWGQMAIGLSLILGLMVRPASTFGIFLMGTYFFAFFESNIEHGFITHHHIYMLVFFLFLAGGAGHMFGIDGILYRNFRRPTAIQKILFG